MTNCASLKKAIDCRGEHVQGYLQITNSECLHAEESEERVECKGGGKWILRCKKVQITVSTTSREQKPHQHIDNVFCFLKMYGFYGFFVAL